MRGAINNMISLNALIAVSAISWASAFGSLKLLIDTEATAFAIKGLEKGLDNYGKKLLEVSNNIEELEKQQAKFPNDNKIAISIQKNLDMLNNAPEKTQKVINKIKELKENLNILVNTDPNQNAIDSVIKPIAAGIKAAINSISKLLPSLDAAGKKAGKNFMDALVDQPGAEDFSAKIKKDLDKVKSYYDKLTEAIKDGNIDRYNSLKAYAKMELQEEIKTTEKKLKEYKKHRLAILDATDIFKVLKPKTSVFDTNDFTENKNAVIEKNDNRRIIQ
jgi:DNA-binding transcriptional regulator GbsR (MarR family)